MHGRKLLRQWIGRRCRTDREAALVLGMDHTHLSQILNGRRSPGLVTSVKIERVTGIAVEAWVPTRVGTSEPPASVTCPQTSEWQSVTGHMAGFT